MNLPIYDVFGIGAAVEDFVRGLFWGIIKVLMNMVTGMLDAMINGVLSFGVLSIDWVADGFQACFIIMFVVIPVKVTYEILFSLLTDNEQTMDYSKKFFGAITAVIIAASVPTAIPMINNLMVEASKVATTDITESSTSLGNTLVSSVYVGFGGMAQQGPQGADKLVESYQTDNFSITERDANDDYMWQFSEFMVIIGMTIYVVLLFAITIQIATRIFMIAFLYIISPLCATSLTKYQDPQAFNVWKNTIMGQMAMNFTQIFGLSFLSNVVGMISNIGTDTFSGLPVTMAQLALYFGAFSLTLSAPSFVQSMIGGYASGTLDTLNQMQSGLHMMKAGTIGLATAGATAMIGRRNSYTGYREGGLRGAIAGNKHNDGTRRGGIVGATVGQKDVHGHRQGGVRGAVVGDTIKRGSTDIRSGGLRSVFTGTKATTTGKDGTRSVLQSGGIVGLTRGSRLDSYGADDSTPSTSVYSGGFRGRIMGQTTVQSGEDGVIRSRSGGARGKVSSLVNNHQVRRQGQRRSQSKSTVTRSSGMTRQRDLTSSRQTQRTRNNGRGGRG